MRKVCPQCGKELKISPAKAFTANVIVTLFSCEDHGKVEMIDTPYSEAKLQYEELEK